MDFKKCTKCGRELPLTEYYSRGNGKQRSECKQCHNTYATNKYQERKEQVNNIKSNYKCQKCGESRSYVLDFHHVDPSKKSFTISRMTSHNNRMNEIENENEISKCIVLCSNCHREFHFLEEKYAITIEEYLL